MNNIIYYTFLAGWCADAAGGRLEFRKQRYSDTEAINALHFIGEKTNGLPEGQFTDDTEMELCLLEGILCDKNNDEFPVEKIAEKYIEWYLSKPFDIGTTTRYSLENAKNADDMANNSFQYNEKSESNGSLMRCIPIAVFCINKPAHVIFDVASIDASLTHYSKRTQFVTGIYCFLISKILRLKINNQSIKNIDLLHEISELCSSDAIVLEWFNIGIKLIDLTEYNCLRNEGHIKHSFVFIIYFLKNIDKYTYEKALIDVFRCGGDTDTNGKIVGNLFGAYHGNCVPKYMSDIVLNYDCSNANKPYCRPKIYGIKHAVKLVKNIVI